MRISFNWLKESVDLPSNVTAKMVGEALTLKTVEVDGIEMEGMFLDHVVVGEIKEVLPHPNANKLQICVTDIGGETHKIVCGGSNVRPGLFCAVGLPGAKVLWHGQGEPVTLTETTIRGQASYGMICASEEIGLGTLFPAHEEKEILDLSAMNPVVGTPLSELLHQTDAIFDIDNKSLSNRPDLWGHVGIAREVGAMFGASFREPQIQPLDTTKPPSLSVQCENPSLSSRALFIELDGIDIVPSPAWMQARLRAVGMQPINIVVDVTNYVMMEIGQPLHAYDAKKITGNTFVIRPARPNESFTSLQEKTFPIPKDAIVIADASKALGLAGIIGGQESRIQENTTRIILEAATFDAGLIRRTSTALGLRTDASMRFEKGLSPALPMQALLRAITLLRASLPSLKVVGLPAEYGRESEPKHIALSYKLIKQKVGCTIPKKTVLDILTRLGFFVSGEGDTFSVTVPAWRGAKDMNIPEDVIEEIVRLYGYNRIPSTLPTFSIIPPKRSEEERLSRSLRECMAYREGFTEISGYSFVSERWIERLQESRSDYLELQNPIAKDRPMLRRSLLPGLIDGVEKNSRRESVVALMELGHVFLKGEVGEESGTDAPPLPKQDTYFGAVFLEKGEQVPFFSLALAVERALQALGYVVHRRLYTGHVHVTMHPTRTAELYIGETMIGVVSELPVAFATSVGVEERVAWTEINVHILSQCQKEEKTYKPLPLFPEIVRDVALFVPRSLTHEAALNALEPRPELLESVELFDVYAGDKVVNDKKSVAYRFTYRSSNRTLTAAEVDTAHQTLVHRWITLLGAEIR